METHPYKEFEEAIAGFGSVEKREQRYNRTNAPAAAKEDVQPHQAAGEGEVVLLLVRGLEVLASGRAERHQEPPEPPPESFSDAISAAAATFGDVWISE